MALAIGGGITFGGGISISPEAGAPTDPFFSDVTLLLHGDGTNGSQTFVDSSLAAQTLTVNGNAQIDTTVKKFGTGSMEFDGDVDSASLPAGTGTGNFDGDFTVECWFYVPNVSTNAWARIIECGLFDSTNTWRINHVSTTMSFIFQIGSPTTPRPEISTGTLNKETWYHIAVVRSGSQIKMYVNGVAQATTLTYSSTFNNDAIWIGRGTPPGTGYFKGFIDDLRITKGVARYTENFTPPTEAFPDQ